MCAAYGWTPDTVASLTPRQVAYFLEHMPDIHLRWAWPVAQLEAAIKNMMGGKRQKERDPDADPPLAPHEVYTPLELLPWYARPEWAETGALAAGIHPEAARDFMQHRRDMPAWVVAIAPVDAIRRAADTTT